MWGVFHLRLRLERVIASLLKMAASRVFGRSCARGFAFAFCCFVWIGLDWSGLFGLVWRASIYPQRERGPLCYWAGRGCLVVRFCMRGRHTYKPLLSVTYTVYLDSREPTSSERATAWDGMGWHGLWITATATATVDIRIRLEAM